LMDILEHSSMPPGRHIMRSDLGSLPAGLYFCRFRIGNQAYIHKFLHTR
jgi:hypothetical protein